MGRTGCPWRYLPLSYPPWPTVYGYVARWRGDGTRHLLRGRLRELARAAAGRTAEPTTPVIDSSAAAGVPLVSVGDGLIPPQGNLAASLSLGPGDPSGECVAASLTNDGPTVVTPQGFRLGGTLAQLKSVYGSSLRYVSPPPFEGIKPPPGYVVSYPDGNLAFGISGNTVQTIAGGPDQEFSPQSVANDANPGEPRHE